MKFSKEEIVEKYSRRRERHVLQQLFWECTLRCNLKCLHCGSDCKVSSATPDMPFNVFETVLDEIAENYDPGRILIITTGGEPLVRKDIIECGRRITEKGFLWGTVSNGMLIDEAKLSELKSAGLRTIGISLDGFEEEHDWLRGSPVSFRRAVRAIKALVSSDGITWDVITCVNRRTINTLDAFKEFLIGIGVRQWRLFAITPMGRAADNDELSLSADEFRQMMDFIVKTKAEGRIKVNFSCEGYLGEYEMRARYYPFFCQAGINVASILSDGSISGCLSIRSEYTQGNILKGDRFIDVWENRFNKYRDHKWMKVGPCDGCNAWELCLGGAFHDRDANGGLLVCHYNEDLNINCK